MKHCPGCGTEYEDFARECMDCRVELRSGPAPADPENDGRRDDVKVLAVRTFIGGAASTDAEVAKNLLESEGIPCFLTGANAARLYHALEVQLMVRQEDGEHATRILKEFSDAAPPADDST
jgi:Putative prokaryotic signal transducing protein